MYRIVIIIKLDHYSFGSFVIVLIFVFFDALLVVYSSAEKESSFLLHK